MKIAISVPDEVFARAEQTAKRLGLSRSEFFTSAVQAFLATRQEQNITASYDAAFGKARSAETSLQSASDTEAFARAAARRALLGVEWE